MNLLKRDGVDGTACGLERFRLSETSRPRTLTRQPVEAEDLMAAADQILRNGRQLE